MNKRLLLIWTGVSFLVIVLGVVVYCCMYKEEEISYDQGTLEVIIEAKRQMVLVGEDILIDIIVKNTTERPLLINI